MRFQRAVNSIACFGWLIVILAAVLAGVGLAVASPLLLTPPHCDSTGCASAKPSGWVIKLPWNESTTHSITNGYGTGQHQGVCRQGYANDYHALDSIRKGQSEGIFANIKR